MITDAQIHLWEADSAQRPWPAGVLPDVDPPMTAERALAMMDAAGVDRAVISPPGVSGYDSGYALEVAARYPDRFAITSRWNLDDPENPARLPTWLDQPGMIGIRLAVLPSNVDRWREGGQLAAFLSAAEQLGVPLMMFTPGGVSVVDQAAQAYPNLKMVFDHVNLVNATPDTVGERVDSLNTLARYPNVGVKLGALPIRSATRYPFDDLREPLMRVYDAFGPDRLMWASDHTTTMKQDKASYVENLDLIRKSALGGVPADDMDRILHRTVSAWFNWPATAAPAAT